MVKVRFYINHGALCLKVEGHANAGPKGEDVVCAGASVLAATLADVVTIMDSHGEMETEPKISMSNGYAFVKAKPKPENKGKLLMVYSVIATGMSAVARNYPEHLSLKLFDQAAVTAFSE